MLLGCLIGCSLLGRRLGKSFLFLLLTTALLGELGFEGPPDGLVFQAFRFDFFAALDFGQRVLFHFLQRGLGLFGFLLTALELSFLLRQIVLGRLELVNRG